MEKLYVTDNWDIKQRKEKLKLDKHLPQILLPQEKLEMFCNWWNSDIRFEKTIPHSFEEGYLFVEYLRDFEVDMNKYSIVIKALAKACKTTYRTMENKFKEFVKSMSKIVLYFKFINENTIVIEAYNNDYERISYTECSFGNEKPEQEIDYHIFCSKDKKYVDDVEEAKNILNYQNLAFLITSLWYIATTTRTTKYIYEKKTPVVVKRHRNTVVVSDSKTISTPIYDMNKIRIVNVEKLSSRKKGWTYSHSFQVHGHYRHYKNGKIVFVNSYIKGKDKEFKSQQIVLSPKEV